MAAVLWLFGAAAAMEPAAAGEELSDACEAANDPGYDTTYADSSLDGPGELSGFFAGEILTVSTTDGAWLVAMLVNDGQILVDTVGPELSITHEWMTAGGTVRWSAFLASLPLTPVAAEWTVSCARPLPVVMPYGFIVTEGGAGATTTMQLPVYLSTPSAETITVDYSTIDDRPAPEATSGVDFTPTTGTLTFGPGETVAYVPIEILGDDEIEVPLYGGEWGVVQFSAVSANATLDTDTFFGAGLFVIVDDDSAATVRFSLDPEA